MAVGQVLVDKPRGQIIWRGVVVMMLLAGVGMALIYSGQHSEEAGQSAQQVGGMSSWMSPSVGFNASHSPEPTFKTGLERMPTSLAGTEVAGDLREDDQGRLIIDKGVRDTFDYFLSSRGEQSDAVLDARIRAYVKHRLGQRAAQQALSLLDGYLAYLQKLDVLSQQSRSGATTEPKVRLAMLIELRSRSFTPDVVQALFGLELAYDQYTVDKMAVFKDASLTPLQKANQLKALRLALPADLQANMDATEVAPTLQAVTQEWRERGGSVADLKSLREALVGKDATARLEALDRDEQNWQTRIQTYLQDRSAIMSDATLAEGVKQEKIQRLVVNSFSATEQLRVSSYERMSDQKLATSQP